MAYGALVRLAGKALGPKMLQKFGGNLGVHQILRDVGSSAAINAGMVGAGQLMQGRFDPGELLAYTAADVLASGAGTAGVRALRGTKGRARSIITDPKTGKKRLGPVEVQRSRLEIPVNVGASILAGMGVSSALAKEQLGQEQGINQANDRQIAAQQVQRAVVNGDPNLLAGAYMPFTNFQNTLNGPSFQAMLEQAQNDSNSPASAAMQMMMNQQLQGANAAAFDANARAIMGL